jgi:predicted aconitase with swiveling domain
MGSKRLSFRGRPVVAGNVSGLAAVSRGGFNTYASYFNSIHEPSTQAICADAGNTDLYGVDLASKVICVPATVGSTSGGAVWQRLVAMGNPPKAVVFAGRIDPVAAGGLIITDVWTGGHIVVVDTLGDAFLGSVAQGDEITIHNDGEIVITRRG